MDERAVRQPQRNAQEEVARHAVAVRARARDGRRERLRDGEPLGSRRIESQHLAAPAERPPQLAQRDGAPDYGGQVARLMLDQNRSATPSRSSGWRRYGPGTSPQRRGVGRSLPGLQSPSGSNARRGAVHRRQVGLREHPRHRAHLVDADPVLARERPARLDAGVEDLGRELLGTLRLALDRGVVEHERMQVAVAGVEHVPDPEAVRAESSLDPAQRLRKPRPRDDAVLDVVVGAHPAHRREGGLAAVPERGPLRVVGGDPHLGSAAAPRTAPGPGGSVSSTSTAGPVELHEQDGARIARKAGVDGVPRPPGS